AAVFLLHIALEIPLAVQGIWSPQALPFMQMTNTTLVMLKVAFAHTPPSFYSYSPRMSLLIVALLVGVWVDFLPGKRAFAIQLCIYHSVASTVLFQAPRFIPHSFGPFAEASKFTPEILWGGLHGILSMGMVLWWQSTVSATQAVKQS
ncbi:uncharacterized protein STEHIDRAFT_52851, partial [Stereum hirsutum FP-91666 SS1]|uniref:uncharacterized protein n=1 Tax=Stereum hirsutum (strain FP-91666) TaxID=721885 RepID=UPI000440E663